MTEPGEKTLATKPASEARTALSAGELRHHDSGALNLLLFSVGGVCFGCDADQVADIAAFNDADSGGLVWFHEIVGYGGRAVTYQSPTIITIRTGNASPFRVIIDSMEEITEFNQADINVFPELMEPFALRMGMWGVLPRHNALVLLIDFQRLLREKDKNPNNYKI
jgi:chemotaxis signal transduction protein